MAGKRILLAAEFLRGAGTGARLLPLAEVLAERGHGITLALPGALPTEPAHAGRFARLDAPRWAALPPPGFVAVSYADLLMHGGYAAPDALRGLMNSWRHVLDQTSPDLLIADFAPTAMLAARIAGIATAAVGDGFSLPPLTSPLPDMRPWANEPAAAVASVEGRVLAVVNARLAALRARELRALRDLFDREATFVCTFPELDHYPERPDGMWFGEVFTASPEPAALWPAGGGERVYVELDPRHPALDTVVRVLHRLELPTLVQAAGFSARRAEAMEQGTVRVTKAGRGAVLAACDIVVCQSQEVAVPALLAGKPLLMLPLFVEQMMTLHRLAKQGLAHGAEPNADAAAIEAAVRQLVDDRGCRLHAVNFGRLYDGYEPAAAIAAVADEIEALLGQTGAA